MEIKAHQKSESNAATTVIASERHPTYGASSVYTRTWKDKDGVEHSETLKFQEGPHKEVGLNGWTDEALIAVLMDRMSAFRNSPFHTRQTRDAKEYLAGALTMLHSRTDERVARGVNGTSEL